MASWVRWLAGFLALPGVASAQPYVVVGPSAFAPAARPLLEARKAQGLAPLWIELDAQLAGDARALAARIHAEIGKTKTPGYLLLLGDSDRGKAPLPTLSRPGLQSLVPGMPGKQRVWSDLGFVDPQDSGSPTWAIGRIPARDAEQVATVVAKILAYEKIAPGPWVRELELVAGDGDFGVVIDTVLNGALRQLFAEELAPGFALGALIALPDSPFFASPPTFGQEVRNRLDAGPFALVYAGHGWIDRFADLRLRGQPGAWPILRTDDVAKLEHAERSIVLAWACHIGEFPREALGEVLLRAPHGPVAVVAASEVSFPFGDFVLGRELMRAQEDLGITRLGDLVKVSKQRALHPDPTDKFGKRAALLAGLMGLDADQQQELRRYTADLYHLLGDPALLLPARGKLDVQVEGRATLAIPLVVQIGGSADAGIGRVWVELCKDRGQDPRDVLLATEVEAQGGRARVTLPWPKDAQPGQAIVRVQATTPGRFWFGGKRFRVFRE